MNVKATDLIEGLKDATEENIIFLPFVMPMPVYLLIEEVAKKRGTTVQEIISEAIREKVEKLGGKTTV